MIRSYRRIASVLTLLGFEVVAIVALHAVGAASSMQVPWDDLGTWLHTSSPSDVVAPLVRLFALVVAYWLLVSTSLCMIAQASRIPSAVRAADRLALPSVRRLVDGAMAVSLVTTSLVGFSGGVAMAADGAPGDDSSNTTTVTGDDDGPVATPSPGAPTTDETTPSTTEAPTTVPPTTQAPTTVPPTTQAPTTVPPTTVPPTTVPPTTVPPTTQAPTTVPPTTQAPTTVPPTTQAPSSTSTTQVSDDDADQSGNAGSDNAEYSVPTPRPGAPTVASTTPRTVPSSVPAPAPAPQDDAQEPAAPSSDQTQVLGEQDHKVVAGENLWTIARDAIAQAKGVQASDVSEAQIRDYWLKLIDANRDNLRSKDPHWIFPDEVVHLPAFDVSSAQ